MAVRLFGDMLLNTLAVASIAATLGAGYLFFSGWSGRYGAWLVVFTIWMVWFTAAFARWFANADV